MTQAKNTQGTTLWVSADQTTWTVIRECKSIPSLVPSVDKLEATSLESIYKEYVPGIKDFGSDMSFTLNMMPKGAVGSNTDVINALSKTAILYWRICYTAQGVQYTIPARWTAGPSAVSVNGVQEYTLTLIPCGTPVESDITDVFSVTYNSNAPSGATVTGTTADAKSYDAGAAVTAANCGYTIPGYAFICWNTSANGTGLTIDDGDAFTILANTTLYAQWTAAPSS